MEMKVNDVESARKQVSEANNPTPKESKIKKIWKKTLFLLSMCIVGFDAGLGVRAVILMYSQLGCLRPVLSLIRVFDGGAQNYEFAIIVVLIFTVGVVVGDIVNFTVIVAMFLYKRNKLKSFGGALEESNEKQEAYLKKETATLDHLFEMFIRTGQGLQMYGLLSIASWNKTAAPLTLVKLILTLIRLDWGGAHLFLLMLSRLFRLKSGFTENRKFFYAKVALTFGGIFYPILSVMHFVFLNRDPTWVTVRVTDLVGWYGCQNPNDINCVYSNNHTTDKGLGFGSKQSSFSTYRMVLGYDGRLPSTLPPCSWEKCGPSLATEYGFVKGSSLNCSGVSLCQAISSRSKRNSVLLNGNITEMSLGEKVTAQNPIRILTTAGTNWIFPIILMNKTVAIYKHENEPVKNFRGWQNFTISKSSLASPNDLWSVNITLAVYFEPHGGCPLD